MSKAAWAVFRDNRKSINSENEMLLRRRLTRKALS